MRLNDRLVTSFAFKGSEYDIDLAFDNVLDMFDVMNDKKLLPAEKIEIGLELLLGKRVPDEIQTDLWSYIFDKYINGEPKKTIQYDLAGNPMPVQDDDDGESFIDIEQDAEYIYASFKQAYNMDLMQEQGKLHWDKFRALLNGLPNDTIMQRVIQIRAWKPTKGDSPEYKESMRKLQLAFALVPVEE